jgi:HAD superfamily hydrolase (TIGR01490 family)
MPTRLALFDLDNTLLAGDSDHAWGEFLIAENLVDGETHRARNDQFYADYEKGELDIHAYVRFTLDPILACSAAEREQLHDRFMRQSVLPMMQEKATALVGKHRRQGDHCLIITATNAFITAPIAQALGVDTLLATELEVLDGKLTGRIAGTPCYQEGKVAKLQQWIAAQDTDFSMDDACFYSDSINDLPLLERVAEPVAVDPDARLADVARARNWPCISLRS